MSKLKCRKLLKEVRTLNIACVESEKYHLIGPEAGDTVIMPCNATPSSGVVWTWKTRYREFSYVYVNGSITRNYSKTSHFSVVNANAGDYNLKIYNVQPAYIGLYDCYDSNGSRIVGYDLRLTDAESRGMFFNAQPLYHCECDSWSVGLFDVSCFMRGCSVFLYTFCVYSRKLVHVQ